MKYIFIALLLATFSYAEVVTHETKKTSKVTSEDLEIQILEEKIQALKEKLSVLEQLKKFEANSEEELDPSIFESIYKAELS